MSTAPGPGEEEVKVQITHTALWNENILLQNKFNQVSGRVLFIYLVLHSLVFTVDFEDDRH